MSDAEELRAIIERNPDWFNRSYTVQLLEAALAEARVEGEIAALEWVQNLHMVRTTYDDVDRDCEQRIEELKGKQP